MHKNLHLFWTAILLPFLFRLHITRVEQYFFDLSIVRRLKDKLDMFPNTIAIFPTTLLVSIFQARLCHPAVYAFQTSA